jgi:Flp pilus assembly protein TadD
MYGELVASMRSLLIGCSATLLIAGCALPNPEDGAAFSRELRTEGELEKAQEHFARGEFGLAEKNFRLAVEGDSQNPEAWLGLAASYDQLARFDLADRSYKRAKQLIGETAILLNNMGYSYMLRGDLDRARRLMTRAQKMDPLDDRIARNIEELNIKLSKIGQQPIIL